MVEHVESLYMKSLTLPMASREGNLILVKANKVIMGLLADRLVDPASPLPFPVADKLNHGFTNTIMLGCIYSLVSVIGRYLTRVPANAHTVLTQYQNDIKRTQALKIYYTIIYEFRPMN